MSSSEASSSGPRALGAKRGCDDFEQNLEDSFAHHWARRPRWASMTLQRRKYLKSLRNFLPTTG